MRTKKHDGLSGLNDIRRTIQMPSKFWWIVDNFRAREDIQGSSEAFRLAILDDEIREKLRKCLAASSAKISQSTPQE